MILTNELCRELVDLTIFGEEFDDAEELKTPMRDRRMFFNDKMVSIFSSDAVALKRDYHYAQEKIDIDPEVPGPFAFMENEEGAVLVVERLK